MIKQPIRILTADFTLLCEIEDYESLTFTRIFQSYGSFELKISKNKNNVNYLKNNNIVFLSPEKAGIIQYRDYAMDSAGKASETLTIRGYTLEHILTYRITEVPNGSVQWTGTGAAEDVLKALISYNMGDTATNVKRKMAMVKIADSQSRGKDINISNRYEALEAECKRIEEMSDLGIKIMFDYSQKKLVIDVYEGKNRTASQGDIPPVIFAIEYDNIASQTLVDSILEYKNTAVVAGQGEGTAREIIYINDDKSGLERRELFVDARDIGADSLTTLEQRGKEKLDELKAVYTIEGAVRPFNSFNFEQDYDLGDTVTVKLNDFGTEVCLDTRITQVTQSWTSEGYAVDIVFGSKIPTILDTIKRMAK